MYSSNTPLWVVKPVQLPGYQASLHLKIMSVGNKDNFNVYNVSIPLKPLQIQMNLQLTIVKTSSNSNVVGD